MKKFLPIAVIAIALFVSSNAGATIRRVGYFGAATAIDYTSLQAAHDAATAGDSIYLYPGSWQATFSKQLVVLGYGYFLTGAGSNPGLQNLTASLTANITLNTGSGSSVFQSVDNLQLSENNGNIVNNVFVNRCHVFVYGNDQQLTGWRITQSFLKNVYNYYSGTFSNFEINNSVILNLNFGNFSSTSGQFNNDFFDGYTGSTPNFNNGNLLFTSCIFNWGISNTLNSTFSYCIGSQGGNGADGGASYAATGLPAGNGNKTVDISTVYVGYGNNTGNYSTDGSYVLSAGSAAKGAGAGGTDCGIFGGTAPYVLSGLPPIPVFSNITAPSATTSSNPYTITISVKSNN